MTNILAAKQQIILRAKQAPGLSQTFSRTYALDPDKVTKVTKLLGSETHPDVRMGNLADPSLVTQYLFASKGTIYPFTRSLVATDATNVAMYVGSMSDDLGTNIPVSIIGERFRAWFTTIMTTEDIHQYKLLHIAAALSETIQGPASSDDIDDGAAPSLARLNFGPNADTDNRLIAASGHAASSSGCPVPPRALVHPPGRYYHDRSLSVGGGMAQGSFL